MGLTKEGRVPIVAQARSDEAGRFTFNPYVSRSGQESGTIWGFKSGLGVGVVDRLRDNQPGRVHRLVLPTPAVRTLTILDAQGKPVAGVRIAPRMVEGENTRHPGVLVPDAWLDRLSVVTDGRGNALLPSLTGRLDLRTARSRSPVPCGTCFPYPIPRASRT